MSTNKSLKTVNLNGLKQGSFLVGTISDFLLSFLLLSYIHEKVVFSHMDVNVVSQMSTLNALRSLGWFLERSPLTVCGVHLQHGFELN